MQAFYCYFDISTSSDHLPANPSIVPLFVSPSMCQSVCLPVRLSIYLFIIVFTVNDSLTMFHVECRLYHLIWTNNNRDIILCSFDMYASSVRLLLLEIFFYCQ